MFCAAIASAVLLTLTQPDPGAATPDRPEQPPALAGPKVQTAERPRSLVERDFAGKLRRLEVDPAQAALALLDLSAEEKAAAERILSERALIMDGVVTENLRQVVEMAQAFQARDTVAGLALAADLYKKAGAFVERGRLVDELAAVLSEDHAAELRRLTQDYWRAAIDESAQEPGPNGRPRGRMGALTHERVVALGNEVRLSFERTVAARGRELEDLLKTLNVSPEQESKIRAVIEETYVATFGKPTGAQQALGFVKIYAVLNDEQRKELARLIREQRSAAATRGKPSDR